MADSQEISPQVENTNASIRCIKNVTRRHSLDYNGSIVSSSVSEARTPRPPASDNADDMEQTTERKIKSIF